MYQLISKCIPNSVRAPKPAWVAINIICVAISSGCQMFDPALRYVSEVRVSNRISGEASGCGFVVQLLEKVCLTTLALPSNGSLTPALLEVLYSRVQK